MKLEIPISALNKVGKTTSKKLSLLGINKVRDLLFYFPFRYEDYSRVTPIHELIEGESITIKGKLELIANKRTRSRKIITEALVSDDSGGIRIIWFNQPFLTKNLQIGKTYYFSSVVKSDMLGKQLVSPAYESADKKNIHTARLVPMYPLTAGITQKQLRFLVEQSLAAAKEVEDWMPQEIIQKQNFLSLPESLLKIHFPSDQTDLKMATDRLKFDELFLIQLQAEMTRIENAGSKAPVLHFHEDEIKKFVSSLPFKLTNSQKISAWEILQNIQDSLPMNRLLSGDVGSGKTVVAAIALYNTALNGYQGVMMAPTEILATQHFYSIRKLLPKIKVVLITGSQRIIYEGDSVVEVNKKELIKKISDGEMQIIIGTHALLSVGVNFKKLGLVIVDEQHRFGVSQRKVIKEKGESVHFLSMTATPIPRSLALMLYGDLNVSLIDELPPERKPIISKLVEQKNRAKAYQFAHDQVQKGRQIFVICPMIENTDEKKAVMSEYKKLSEHLFPDLKVHYLHGKMKSKEKDEIMNKFKNREVDILVSTSVIEVGVDIPNATVMIIEGAERFGLAQLHQFRGRVGRGAEQSYCLLFTETETRKSTERLKFFETHHNGFALAEKDLEIRGPGEVYGTMQSGMMQLRLAKLTDKELIKKARDEARRIAPEISNHELLQKRVEEWRESVHLE